MIPLPLWENCFDFLIFSAAFFSWLLFLDCDYVCWGCGNSVLMGWFVRRQNVLGWAVSWSSLNKWDLDCMKNWANINIISSINPGIPRHIYITEVKLDLRSRENKDNLKKSSKCMNSSEEIFLFDTTQRPWRLPFWGRLVQGTWQNSFVFCCCFSNQEISQSPDLVMELWHFNAHNLKPPLLLFLTVVMKE